MHRKSKNNAQHGKVKALKVKCPDCKQRFDFDAGEFDEGDLLNCPECNLEITVILNNGKLNVQASKEKELEEESEFDDYFED